MQGKESMGNMFGMSMPMVNRLLTANLNTYLGLGQEARNIFPFDKVPD